MTETWRLEILREPGMEVKETIKNLTVDGVEFAVASGASFGTFAGQPEESHRYALWRVWDSTRRPLVVVGLNPSKATHEIEDLTVKKCILWAFFWGFGGLVMLNVFSYRATMPTELREERHPHAWPMSVTGGGRNDRQLLWYARQAGLVLAAWGNGGQLCDRGRQVYRMLEANHIPVWCVGRTNSGEPKHPCRLANEQTAVRYQRDAA